MLLYRIPIEKYRYLERNLNNNFNYAQEFVVKIFNTCSQVENKIYLIEFLKNLPQIYYSIGSKSFEKSIYPNLKDWMINSTTFE